MTINQIPPRRVVLDGELGDKFGREWELRAPTPQAALALIRANRPGLVRYLADCHREGIGFVVLIDGKSVSMERLLTPISYRETLVIMPWHVAAGDNKGVWQIVAGIALIAVSFFIPAASAGFLGSGIGASGFAGFVGNLGFALALGGAAQLIAGQPDFSLPEESTNDNKPSYLFDGPTNRVRQGNARPVIYGNLIVGGQPISLGINNEEWIDPADADQGTITGPGYSEDSISTRADDDSSFKINPFRRYGGYTAAGGKGGDSGSRQAVEAPDSYRSIAYGRVQDLIGEGEIYGPLDQNWNLISASSRLGAALFLDETPVMNESNGSFNFRNVRAWLQVGTPTQKHVPGFGTTESENSVNVEVTKASSSVQTITDTTVDAVRVTVRLPQMYERNLENGDVKGSTVQVEFELDYDSGGYNSVLIHTFRQKNMNPTHHSFRFDLNTFSTDVKIRMKRLSDDEPKSHIQNRTFFHAYTEIQDEKLNHPNTAKLSLDIDATQFNRIPARALRVGGLKIRIPDNYDPIEKTYSGVWGGGYDVEWTNNPAWILLDLMTNVRYGLGRWIDVTQNDTASLYTIGQECDELVTTGKGETLTLIESFSSSATSIVISVPVAWIADGDTLTFPLGDVTVDGKVRKGAIDSELTSGSLIVGADYRITDNSGSADWTNVGAEDGNTLNTVFTATGTTPTSWGTGSLQPLYKTISVDSTPVSGTQDDEASYTGKEPRFECNLMIETQEDAYKVIKDISSVLRGMTYWGGGLYKVVQDVVKDSVMQFTNSNVVGGFKYTSTALKARHTVANVRYNEPGDFFRSNVIFVDDPKGIFKWGVREKQLTAIGCTSQSQAMRYGKSVMVSERLESQGIEFEAGAEGGALQVGDIIDTYDNTQADAVLAGRLSAVTTTTADLDRSVTLEAATTYNITFVKGDGTGMVSSQITTGAGTVSSVTFNAISSGDLPTVPGVWFIQDTSSTTKKSWRVLSVVEKKRESFNVIGLAYASEKYDLIENIERQANRADLDEIRRVEPVSNLDVVTEKIDTATDKEKFATVTWDESEDKYVRSYLVTYRRGDNDWSSGETTLATNLRIKLDAPGDYEFQVVAINMIGIKSGPQSATFTLTEKGLVVGDVSEPIIDPKGAIGAIKPDGTVVKVTFQHNETFGEVRYAVMEQETLISGTPTSGEWWYIAENTGADFTGIGAPDNNIGTEFIANGGTPTWGSGGQLVKVTDHDPLTTAKTVNTYNPNWLQYSNDWTNAAWTKTNGTATTVSVTGISDPDGSKTSSLISPTSGLIEVSQSVTPERMYKGQEYVFSVWERVVANSFANLTLRIEEDGGAESASSTDFDFKPTAGGWTKRQFVHKVEQTDRTTLKVYIIADTTDNPSAVGLYLFKSQLEWGNKATKYKETEGTAGGTASIPDYNGIATVKARVFVRDSNASPEDGVHSDMVEASYDRDSGALKIAEPDVRPFGRADFEGTEFPITVTIEQDEPGMDTYYTTDGSTPTTGSTLYSAPFEVEKGTTVKAYSDDPGGSLSDSEIREESYSQGF